MKIVVDSREPDYVKSQARKEFDDMETAELETADFAVLELGIGVERKEASDFASSVQQGRMSEQGDRLVEEFEHRYVILEGEGLYNLKYSNMSSRSLIGQQVSLAAKRDIRLLYTDSVEGTLFAVRRLVERVAEGESVGHVKTQDVETDRTDVAMLAQIEGVSEELAIDILDEVYFDTLTSCASDYEGGGREIMIDSLQCIDGVGEVLAERIINAFS